MTRRSQEQAERSVLERLLSMEGIVPETPPEKGERPDFMTRVSGQTIGVEVTTYQSGITIAVPGKGRRNRREVEPEWECLKCFSESFRDEHPNLKNTGVIFWFRNLVPPKNEYHDFLVEVEKFIFTKYNDLRHTLLSIQITSLRPPLMKEFIRDIGVNIHEGAEWDSDKASGGFVDPPAGIISGIVKSKSVDKKGKTITYRNTDELWLVIDSSGRNSETNLPITGVKELNEHEALKENVENAPFTRVYSFTAMGLFSWHRDRGWQGPDRSSSLQRADFS